MRRVSYLLFLLIGIIQSDALWGQTNPATGGYCGSDLIRTVSASPETRAREERINHLLYQLLDGRNRSGRSAQGAGPNDIYTIPIVVHIVHNGGSENISDAQVLAGIQHMNDAFANVGVYDPSTGVSVGIQFCLAKQDPSGVFTTGITRTVSPLTDLVLENQDGDLKNLVRWDPRSYLNIWLVKEISSASAGSGVAGYAYFPSSHGRDEDGIVGEARWFGSAPASTGMFVHEVGHYLGLYHTFEGGCSNYDCLAEGDRVCDTPPDATTAPISCGTTFNSCTTDADDGSVNNPFRPVSSGGIGEQNDLFSDYMDYGRWECYSVFTQGQKDRMRAALTTVRKSLLDSKGCLSPCANPAIASFTASATSVTVGTTVNFTNTSTRATSYEWRVDGAPIATSVNASHTFNIQGRYSVALKAMTGDPGCTDIDSITIVVTCPVRASFSTGSTTILPGESVTFTGTSTGANTYEWLIDGVPVGTGRDLTHLFNTAGGYRVALIASNGICRDTSLGVYVRVGMCEPSKRWNVWHFGNGAGIDFNSGNPVAFGGGINEHEGVTSISDRDGNLLLYSDGLTVWNRKHTPIPGGTNLRGHLSYGSSQGALLVPAPGSTTLYYLFTTSNWTDTARKLRYWVIDMSLDGGYGGMTSDSGVLNDNVAEQLAAVMHGNCRDIWIVSHEYASNRYVAYLLTPSGLVTTPVVSAVGATSSGSNRYGYMKFSQDAKLLSTALGGSSTAPTLELFDFDDLSGRVSNARALATGPELADIMSSEFSPDGRYLYASSYYNYRTVYQFDLSSGDAAAIRASRAPVVNASKPMVCYQLGPDGRIYIASWGGTALAVIQYPNQDRLSCGFVEQGVSLQGRFSGIGLPTPVTRYGERSIKISGPQSVCLSDSVQTYTVDSRGCSRTGHVWRVTGNAEIISQADRIATVLMKGPGAVRLIVEKVDGCGLAADTLDINATSGSAHVDLGPDTALCSSGNLVLDAGPADGYRWQDGSTGRTLRVSTPGIYWVELQNGGGCVARDTIQVFPSDENMSVYLGPDMTMCDGNVLVLNPSIGGVRYRWQDGSTDGKFTVYRPGTYWVEIIGYCGHAFDTIVIHPDTSARLTLGNDTALCGAVDLLLDAGPGYVSYLWQDGSSGQTFRARGQGIYWVDAVLPSGCIARDTMRIDAGGGLTMNLGADTVMCEIRTLVLDAGPGFTGYRWQDGSTGRTFAAPGPGSYWVEVDNGAGCVMRDTITIADGSSAIDLGHDTTICGAIDLLLDAGPGYVSYLWQDGSTGRTLHVTAPGTYRVRAWSGTCEVEGSITIDEGRGGVSLTASLAAAPSMEIPPGTEITIPLVLTSASGGSLHLGGTYTATIRFNGTVLLPTGSTPQGTIRDGERMITLSGTVGGSDTLALMTFMVLLGDSERTFVSIDSFSVAGDCVDDVARQGGTVSVSICHTTGSRLILNGEAASLAVRHEHPASKRVAIEYVLIEVGRTRLSLFDGRGERVRIISEEVGLAGHHAANLDVRALDAGLYFVLLETPTEMLVKKFLVGE